MVYREHITKLVSAVTVFGAELIDRSARADMAPTPKDRLEYLHEVKEGAVEIMRAVDAAIAKECEGLTPAQAAQRVREAVGD